MTVRAPIVLAVAALAGCASLPPEPTVPRAPRVDYHTHLVSPRFAEIAKFPEFDGPALIAKMDEAGIGKSVVLSVGYSLADERKALSDPDGLTRAENDWTAAQVAKAPDRLVGFCSANPRRDAALDELARCLSLPGMRGIKLHFGNSGVSLREDAHLARLIQVFALAEARRAAVLVHMRARGGQNFGAQDARLFLEKLVPAAPRSELIVGHFGGAGPGYPAQADEVMAVFAAAAERRDPRMKRVFFEMSTILTKDSTPADGALIAKRMRQVGMKQVLYGTDLVVAPGTPQIAEAWGYMMNKAGLTPAELRTIAGNRLDFVR